MRATRTVAISSGLVLALVAPAHAQAFGMRQDTVPASSALFLKPVGSPRVQAFNIPQDTAPARQLLVGNSATLLLPGSPSIPVTRARLLPVQAAKKPAGTTLMIVGAAGLIAGGIIGGTEGALIALGGVAIGAYGVYLFVNA